MVDLCFFVELEQGFFGFVRLFVVVLFVCLLFVLFSFMFFLVGVGDGGREVIIWGQLYKNLVNFNYS